VVFVDDRVKNLDAARELGVHTVCYGFDEAGSSNSHRTISRLAAIFDEPINEFHEK
jgi:FMN phosphatase YigB (HAD superfamily)